MLKLLLLHKNFKLTDVPMLQAHNQAAKDTSGMAFVDGRCDGTLWAIVEHRVWSLIKKLSSQQEDFYLG
ncbi:hypothetical protein IFM89_004007 [Coptis chinensis]|uniref:Uncharacterized protein n=1 Tax=Coptis chinensis TaxID=261450 RepID=A0A835GUG0_9MAGN|nr:hypothetical protein IFM89_004007 [Coptis chinensis]